MNKPVSLFIRYALILIAGLGNLFIFYKFFYPITFYLSSFILSFFGEVINLYALRVFIYNQTVVELINACIAGSAYYLLFILALAIPGIILKKRIYILAFSFGSLLILNVLRIVLMSLIAETAYFESVHMLFWYFVSLIFVVGIWFSAVKLFSIKEIPIYSDLVYLVDQIKKPKRKSKHKKSSN